MGDNTRSHVVVISTLDTLYIITLNYKNKEDRSLFTLVIYHINTVYIIGACGGAAASCGLAPFCSL